MTTTKTPGQLAYERDVAIQPLYHDGTQRRTWEQVSDHIRQSWERNPTDRGHRKVLRDTPPATNSPLAEAMRLIRELVECAELNQDDMEPETRDLVAEARNWLCDRAKWEAGQ